MKKRIKRMVKTDTIKYIKCDICGKKVDPENDFYEAEEFISILHYAGYGSVFGDGAEVETDWCQNCFHNILKEKDLLDKVKAGY